jgi:UDP-N-acetyl-D-glucosamine dehydrogenase
MLLLQRKGAQVTYTDPHVPVLHLDGESLLSQGEHVDAEADCVAVITDHAAFDFPRLLDRARLIVDTRNAFRGVVSSKIVRL